MAYSRKLTPEQLEERRRDREEEFGKKQKPMEEKTPENNNEPVNNNELKDNVNNEAEKKVEPAVDQTQTQNQNTNTDNKNNAGPGRVWKPFAGNKIERDYSTPKIDEKLKETVIPEVDINIKGPATGENTADILNKPQQVQTQATNAPIEKPNPVNKDWDKMSPQEQQSSAEQTTEIILGVYDKLHYFGREVIKVNEQEIIEKHHENKLDMYASTIENDDDPEKDITVKEFWEDFNKQVDDKFILTEKFKNDVRPPMNRLCLKYGLGASDGLYLAFKFGEDAATKIVMAVGFKKTVNYMMDVFEKKHEKFKAEVEKEVQKRLKKENQEKATTEVKPEKETTNTPASDIKEEKIITEENKNEVK